MPHQEKSLLTPKPDPFTYGLCLGYKQNLGGPDGLLLYQFSTDLTAEYRLQLICAGAVPRTTMTNSSNHAPSGAPGVRTDLRQYMTTSDITMTTF